MIRRHPSTEALRRWLLGDAEDEQVSEHVADCGRCATKLEQIDHETAEGAQTPADGNSVAAALHSLLAPAEGLSERVEVSVVDRLGSRQYLAVLGDLFGAGIETSRLLLTEEEPP